MAVKGNTGAESPRCVVIAPKIRDGRLGHFCSFSAYVSGFLHSVSSPPHKRQVKKPRIAQQSMQEPKQLPKWSCETSQNAKINRKHRIDTCRFHPARQALKANPPLHFHISLAESDLCAEEFLKRRCSWARMQPGACFAGSLRESLHK